MTDNKKVLEDKTLENISGGAGKWKYEPVTCKYCGKQYDPRTFHQCPELSKLNNEDNPENE